MASCINHKLYYSIKLPNILYNNKTYIKNKNIVEGSKIIEPVQFDAQKQYSSIVSVGKVD